MFRANPDRFKTPGAQINLAARGDVFLLTAEQPAELKAINRQWLLTSPTPNSHSGSEQPQQLTQGEGESLAAGEERAT
jgi:hypothetical protein